jgi:putative hydrolase of the HAD superfamily
VDTLIAGVPETLQALKDGGYRLGVISNRSTPFGDYLETIGLAGYFEMTLAAVEVDSWKPDPAIFHHALERMGECNAGVIYIGDNYYADVIGARRAGVQPVLLDPERVFPDADCPVIYEFEVLKGLLAKAPGPSLNAAAE